MCDHVYYLAFFAPYDGYYSETDRTGTVQKTIHSSQRPPPTTVMYIYIFPPDCGYMPV